MQLRKPTGMSRERALKALTVVGLTVSLASLNASAGGVGFRDLFVEADGERLTTALWYSTEVPSGQMTLGPFSMTATPGAPVGALFGDESFEGVEVPAQIHRLEGDRVLQRPWHADNIMKLMGNKASLVVHPKAHHFAFISPFPGVLVDEVGAPAHDPPGFDRRVFLSRIDGLIVRFFDDVLLAS